MNIYEYKAIQKDDFHMRHITFYVIAHNLLEAQQIAINNEYIDSLVSLPIEIEYYDSVVGYLLRHDEQLKYVDINKYARWNNYTFNLDGI